MSGIPAGRGGSGRAWIRWAALGMIVGGAAMFLLHTGGFAATSVAGYFMAVGPGIGIAQLLLTAGAVGLWSDHSFGGGALARTGLGLAIVGLAVLAISNLVRPFGDLWYFAAAASVLAPLGFILAGVAELRNHAWTGWERFVPLGVGILPIVIVYPGLALGGSSAVGEFLVGVWGLAFVVLGWAELREPPLEPIRIRDHVSTRRPKNR
ncbi:hypothetical protein SCMU_15850 [Sinomonas cyclohexanicum]|uniref:Uncharacterized protein n=1 Tax=Sinomonas cyclohexanicum TaxID=322009 RepID=A0ABN6FIS3_SINCY|nr:hypothetical protein [Corynebacterium cyclohexanicum]BCT75743.1 hypothetical protein SCMU_15850 [Corynebacterium cyclohexanicum]